MRIATWNINSIRQRIENVTAWLTERSPDIVCLQETKTVDEAFPREPIEALGYNVAVHGQKTFNGVAIPIASDGRFLIAFDRDAAPAAELVGRVRLNGAF